MHEAETLTFRAGRAPPRHDRERAQAYAARGRGYSEKARYSRFFKLISPEEYQRPFDLAMKDHDRAVTLAPEDADLLVSRGRTYYDRAVLETGPPGAAFLYLKAGQHDKSWQVVRNARRSRRYIDSDVIDQLKKASGRES